MPGSSWLQLPSEGVGRNSKGAVVIIRMVVPPLSSGLEAAVVHRWFPTRRSAHTFMHARGAQLSCNADNIDHTFLPGRPSSPCGWKRQVRGGCFGREVLEAEGLVGLMSGHAHVAWWLGHSQHPCYGSGPSQNTLVGSHTCTAAPSSWSPISCTKAELPHALKSQPENVQWHPQKTGWKRVVTHTFSPFGPVLPGCPGGPYTTKKQRKYTSDQVYKNTGWNYQGQGCGRQDRGNALGTLLQQPHSLCRLRAPETP